MTKKTIKKQSKATESKQVEEIKKDEFELIDGGIEFEIDGVKLIMKPARVGAIKKIRAILSGIADEISLDKSILDIVTDIVEAGQTANFFNLAFEGNPGLGKIDSINITLNDMVRILNAFFFLNEEALTALMKLFGNSGLMKVLNSQK